MFMYFAVFMGSSALLGSSIGPDPTDHLLPPSYCTHLLASTMMGPDASLPWEEDKDPGDTGDFVSGPAFAISFLPGCARAVKPLPALHVKVMSSLGELGLEFGKGLGSI